MVLASFMKNRTIINNQLSSSGFPTTCIHWSWLLAKTKGKMFHQGFKLLSGGYIFDYMGAAEECSGFLLNWLHPQSWLASERFHSESYCVFLVRTQFLNLTSCLYHSAMTQSNPFRSQNTLMFAIKLFCFYFLYTFYRSFFSWWITKFSK